MSLLALQRDMRAWLAADEDEGVARLGVGAAPGLRVYQNNYRAALVACLTDSFKQTGAWIGGDALYEAIVFHVMRVPPSSWTLDAYTRDFPESLSQLYPDDPEVAELAWIDHALGEAFVGADSPAIGPAEAATIDWDAARLHLVPTLAMAPLTTNATAIWAALAAGEDPPGAEPLPAPGAILVWRQDQVSQFRAIDLAERDALVAVQDGQSFAELCAAHVEAAGEEAGIARVGGWLGQWLADGLIAGVSVQSP